MKNIRPAKREIEPWRAQQSRHLAGSENVNVFPASFSLKGRDPLSDIAPGGINRNPHGLLIGEHEFPAAFG